MEVTGQLTRISSLLLRKARDRTQVFRLGGRHLNTLSHLTSPVLQILTIGFLSYFVLKARGQKVSLSFLLCGSWPRRLSEKPRASVRKDKRTKPGEMWWVLSVSTGICDTITAQHQDNAVSIQGHPTHHPDQPLRPNENFNLLSSGSYSQGKWSHPKLVTFKSKLAEKDWFCWMCLRMPGIAFLALSRIKARGQELMWVIRKWSNVRVFAQPSLWVWNLYPLFWVLVLLLL